MTDSSGEKGGGPTRSENRSGSSSETTTDDNDCQLTIDLAVLRRTNALVSHDTPSIDLSISGMAVGEQLDAFRELRTRLLAMASGIGLQRFTVLVVPVAGGSGSSFIARNLAVAFTLQEQQRAVLIDCNLRNPSQHLTFELLAAGDGLFDYIENPHARIERLLCRTKLPGLYLIPAGTRSSSTREYFSSYAMRALLTWLRKTPYFLVLDGPPVKGSPDARILSELADFVVLVAGYGRDSAEGIAQAAALFDPAKFAGVVFNDRD